MPIFRLIGLFGEDEFEIWLLFEKIHWFFNINATTFIQLIQQICRWVDGKVYRDVGFIPSANVLVNKTQL